MFEDDKFLAKDKRVNRLACDKVAQDIMKTCIEHGIGKKPETPTEYLFRHRQMSSDLMKSNYPVKE